MLMLGTSPADLDRQSFTPLYVQLVELLARPIRQGEIVPGAAFFSERELAVQYGVSSVTARRVMLELVRAGLIERRNGIGTFVRAEGPRKHVTLLILEFKEAQQRGHQMIASAFGELVGGVAEAAWDSSAALGLAYLAQPEELPNWLATAREEHTTDGVLVRSAGDISAQELDILDRSTFPYVLVKRHLPGRSASAVIADEERAVRLGVDHLLGLGHRRIGFVASTRSRVLHEERFQGYSAALAAAGIELDAGLIVPTPDFSAESGELAARELLQRPDGGELTALMVASDSLAIGAYRAIAARGRSIPSDLSVVSVDDIPEARALHPALTTARTSHVEFGLRATRLLLRLIEAVWKGTALPAQADVIEPTLIVRESTAPPYTALTGSVAPSGAD